MGNIDFSKVVSLETAKATSVDRLLQLLAEHRWLRENEGVKVTEEAHFQSDRTTRAELSSLLTNFELGTIQDPITWKALSGWEVLGKDQLRHVLSMLNAHAQACFAAEKTVAALIEADEIKSAEDFDDAFRSAYESGST